MVCAKIWRPTDIFCSNASSRAPKYNSELALNWRHLSLGMQMTIRPNVTDCQIGTF